MHSLIALPSAVSPFYNRLDPDTAAAFPSLHAAFPLLAALALWPATRRGAALAFAWSAAVWFSVVYLGQHYVTDVMGGIAFALGAWLVTTQVLVPMVPALQRRPARPEPGPDQPPPTDLDPAGPGASEALGPTSAMGAGRSAR